MGAAPNIPFEFEVASLFEYDTAKNKRSPDGLINMWFGPVEYDDGPVSVSTTQPFTFVPEVGT